MSHQKTRLPLGLAATLSAATAISAAAAAPPPAPHTPGATAPVSHNEQGNFRLLPGDELVTRRAVPPPPPPPPPCPADHNGDGAVTSADVSAFLSTWMQSLAAGTLHADFDGSGATTSADISAYLNAWVAASITGC